MERRGGWVAFHEAVEGIPDMVASDETLTLLAVETFGLKELGVDAHLWITVAISCQSFTRVTSGC